MFQQTSRGYSSNSSDNKKEVNKNRIYITDGNRFPPAPTSNTSTQLFVDEKESKEPIQKTDDPALEGDHVVTNDPVVEDETPDFGSVSGDKRGLKEYGKLKELAQQKIAMYSRRLENKNPNDDEESREKLTDWTAVQNELEKLENSDTKYYIKTGVKLDSKRVHGKLTYNKDIPHDIYNEHDEGNSGAVQINISKNATALPRTLLHELKHAYQYEEGKVAFSYSHGGALPELYDLADEIEAYKRGTLLDLEYEASDVDEGYLKENMTEDRYNELYGEAERLNFENQTLRSRSTHNLHNGNLTNEEILERSNIGRARTNSDPDFIYKGWEKAYNRNRE